jgi:radical SAM protein with 4Fe4S-binding SPASM domain
MTLDEFKYSIDSAKEDFGHIKMLQLYNFGEPLINKNIVDMVNYAVDTDISEQIRIYTNGALLNPEMSRNLTGALNRGKKSIIQFSIEHVNDDGYFEIAKSRVSYDGLLTNIAYFYLNCDHEKIDVICKLINDCVTAGEAQKFLSDFGKIGNSVHVELLEQKSEKQIYQHKQKVITYDGHKTTVKKVCTAPFYILAVRSNLDVIGCSEDIFRLNCIGNLKDSSLRELWNSEQLFKCRKLHLSGKTNDICSYCTRFAQQLDDIDDVAEELLERLKNSRIDEEG